MYISTHQALVDFCQRAREFDAIAVDTEFLRERTFHPRLCLVQIATPAESVSSDGPGPSAPPPPRVSRSILW